MGGAAGSQYLLGARPRQLVYEFLHLLRASNRRLESQKKGGRSHPTLQASKFPQAVRPPSVSATQSAMYWPALMLLSKLECCTPPSRSVKIFSSRLGLLTSCS